MRVGIFHGAGYVGRELIKLVAGHPRLCLHLVGSSSFEGLSVIAVHPGLRGKISARLESLQFFGSTALVASSGTFAAVAAEQGLDVIISCARHGSGASEVETLRKNGFQGLIIDMSADLRFRTPEHFEERFGRPHPAPHLLQEAKYGLPEIHPVSPGTSLIANPGCFATGIALALKPLENLITEGPVGITALTGASGSGSIPLPSTHFPDRDGNVRSYKVLEHDHEQEVIQCLDGAFDISFVPVSGPFSRGIWGSIHVSLGEDYCPDDVARVFSRAYFGSPFVRLWEAELPQLHFSVNTPFCDLGWKLAGRKLVVGFALDNLLKGAASQAIQNLNLSLGLDERLGLLPESTWEGEKVRFDNPGGVQKEIPVAGTSFSGSAAIANRHRSVGTPSRKSPVSSRKSPVSVKKTPVSLKKFVGSKTSMKSRHIINGRYRSKRVKAVM